MLDLRVYEENINGKNLREAKKILSSLYCDIMINYPQYQKRFTFDEDSIRISSSIKNSLHGVIYLKENKDWCNHKYYTLEWNSYFTSRIPEDRKDVDFILALIKKVERYDNRNPYYFKNDTFTYSFKDHYDDLKEKIGGYPTNKKYWEYHSFDIEMKSVRLEKYRRVQDDIKWHKKQLQYYKDELAKKMKELQSDINYYEEQLNKDYESLKNI